MAEQLKEGLPQDELFSDGFADVAAGADELPQDKGWTSRYGFSLPANYCTQTTVYWDGELGYFGGAGANAAYQARLEKLQGATAAPEAAAEVADQHRDKVIVEVAPIVGAYALAL